MKHLVTLAIVIIVCYVLWQISEPATRTKALGFVVQHAFKLGLLLLALLLLVALANYTPSISFL